MHYDIIDYCGPKPRTIATLTMTDGVITCDTAWFFEDLTQNGIGAGPPDFKGQVYPADGEKFWTALPFHFSGMAGAVLRE